MRNVLLIFALVSAAVPLPAHSAIAEPSRRVAVTDGQWKAIDSSCPTNPADSKLRQRLVDVAVEEWKRFKFPVTDHRKKGRDIVVSPEGGELIPAKLNKKIDGIARGALRLGYMEDDRAVRKAIGGYWAVVPGEKSLAIQSEIFREYPTAGWAYPWSAAFISYVFCEAGVADLSKFKRASSHWVYVDQAIATTNGLASGLLKARDIATGLPNAGDLLCADRADTDGPLLTIADRLANPGARDMHCDLVVKVKSGTGGYVAMIGGNVVQSASMTLINIVPSKDGNPARVETSDDVIGARPWFAVLEPQVQGDVVLENAPAIRAIKTTR